MWYISLFIVIYILWTGLFLPRVISAHIHLKTESPRLKFAKTHLFTKDITNKNIGIPPVLNTIADNEGERGDNKTEANISLFQYIQDPRHSSDAQH